MKPREFYLCDGELFKYAKGTWWHLEEFDKDTVVRGATDPQCKFRGEYDTPISNIYARLKGWPE